MRLAFFSSLLLLTASATQAATPIDGWYSGLFVGYAYIPNNINTIHQAIRYQNASYEPGYNGGGNFGYKSRPMRYEAEVTYFNANLKHFAQNQIRQTHVGGYNNGVMGMANVYYDAPGMISCLEPFIGGGIGYAWLNIPLRNLSTTAPSSYRITSSAFAYQGTVGVTYNFAENYALNIGYRYLATPHVFKLGHMFQTNLANVGITYRYENDRYK